MEGKGPEQRSARKVGQEDGEMDLAKNMPASNLRQTQNAHRDFRNKAAFTITTKLTVRIRLPQNVT